MTLTTIAFAATPTLDIAYEAHGSVDGWPVLLMHGFPYDVRAYDEVVAPLVSQGARVVVPFLRGYGATRFRSSATLRSGQQAVLGADLVDLLDALGIERAIVAGYDWGGRAACVASALYPERVRALVSVNSYNIQDIAKAGEPKDPASEHRLWYQYYFHGERGRRGLEANRGPLCKLLWQLWSPTWRFDDATYDRTSPSFDNADFVEIVIHSYRHRFGLVDGDPAVAALEQRLAGQPPITVPAITLDGADDNVTGFGGTAAHAGHFVARHEHRVVAGVGHNLPQEAPVEFADAVLTVHRWTA